MIPNNEITRQIIDTYKARSSRMNFSFHSDYDYTNKYYVCQQLRQELLAIHPDAHYVCDMLIHYLFGQMKSRRKVVFWECFGPEVVENLMRNIDRNSTMYLYCGVRFCKESPRQFMCPSCTKQRRRVLKNASDLRRRAKAADILKIS